MKLFLLLTFLSTTALLASPTPADIRGPFATITAQTTAGKPYVVDTQTLATRQETRTGRDWLGRSYSYQVTVVTLKDVYSNGATWTYTRVSKN